MKQSSFLPDFVDTVPETLEEGRLYISIRFRTASHLCACGCGSRVVTPIKPAKWTLIYNGEAVSLYASIGRWQSPCRSHYWIRENQVIWSRSFSKQEIQEVFVKDANDLRDYYTSRREPLLEETEQAPRQSFLSRLWHRITNYRKP
jgi:hypothetical protein